MNAVKIIQTRFNPNRCCEYPSFGKRTSEKLCNTLCVRSKSNDSSSNQSSPSPPPGGDPRKQELLAKIAMLQTQKLRLTDYLDERSAYLTQFAEEANAEIDAIGENALKDLDDATARIMENIESKMQAFEEASESSKEEIEKSDKELMDFEGEIVKGRNEGMFFQSFQEKPPVDKAKAKEEANKIKDITKQSAGSETRRNVYLALIGIVAVGIADAFVSASVDSRKVAVLGAIFVGLLSQLVYEQKLLFQSDNGEGKKDEKE